MKYALFSLLIALSIISFASYLSLASRITEIEHGMIHSFPMRYLRGYIDSLGAERFKDLSLIEAAVIYHNFVLHEEMPNKYAQQLDEYNNILGGIEGSDTMMQYGMEDR